MAGYTIERNGLVSQQMLFSSLAYDLVREGMFKPCYTMNALGVAGTAVDGSTVKATLEFIGDEAGEGVMPWRLQVDGSADVDGGQLIVGTPFQLPNDGSFYKLSDPAPQTTSVVAPDIIGKIGVTQAVISGMKPICSMTSLDMRVTGGLVALNGQTLYIPDSDPTLIITGLDTNAGTSIGVAADGTLVTNDSSAPIQLFTVYTNTNGVYSVSSEQSGMVASAFTPTGTISAATPYSYRLSVVPRGITCEIWQDGQLQERQFSWFVIQRMVDSMTGLTGITGHSPVVCLYSVGNSNIPLNYDIIAKSINKIIVRENDQAVPTLPQPVSSNQDYVNSVINPMKQITTAESNQYYVIFPSGINTHRHLYNDEVDLIAYTSAGVLSQWSDASINVYGECVVQCGFMTADLVPGVLVTAACIDQNGDPISVAGYIKTVNVLVGTLLAGDAVGSLVLYNVEGGDFSVGAEIQVSKILSGIATMTTAAIASAPSINTMRKYRGGNANYNTAEGMRILFLVKEGGITKDFGIIQGMHNIPDAPTIDEVDYDEEGKTVTLMLAMPSQDVNNPITLIIPDYYNIFWSNRDDFSLQFTNGNSRLRAGSQITSLADPLAFATITDVTLTSGSLITGDATGILTIDVPTIRGAFISGDSIKVDANIAATCVSFTAMSKCLSTFYTQTGVGIVPGSTLTYAAAAVATDATTDVQGGLSDTNSIYITDPNTPKNAVAIPTEFGFTVQWDTVA